MKILARLKTLGTGWGHSLGPESQEQKRKEAYRKAWLSLSLFCCFSPFAVDFFPYGDLWEVLYFIFSDVQAFGICALACTIIPYNKLKWKILFFVFSIWKALVFFINLFDLFNWYSPLIIIFMYALYGVYLWRTQVMHDIQTREPKGDEACYYLVPVHSPVGMIQALIMPWHFGKYETRAVSDGEHVWIVHKRRFCKMRKDLVKLNDAVCIPLGRRLTLNELRTLTFELEGQKVTTGIKDCRKLFVAGPVENFL